jgi:nucleoside-diphosphate-sugar epimerase
VVLRFAQFYAPDSTHTRAFNATTRLRVNRSSAPEGATISFIYAEDAGSAVVARYERSGCWRGRRRAGDPRRRGRIVAEALGVKQLRGAEGGAGHTPASVKLLMRSLRVSNRRFKEATGWRPAPHRSGSWPA